MDKRMEKKKLAAAIAGVFACIKTGEELAASQAAAPDPVTREILAQPGQQINLWGVTGRQSLMQAGAMMQMRMFK